ncbi:MAG: hypothetical protein ACUVSX_07275 [Aggregatilineales bacterium]
MGRASVIETLKRHPLARAIRPDELLPGSAGGHARSLPQRRGPGADPSVAHDRAHRR